MSLFLERNVDIKFNLNNQNFDGPFDLLLTLINREEIEIKEIFVSDITSQYLDYVSNMENKDTEYAAEFVVMAAKLLYIKSKAILPHIETDEVSPEEEIILGLEEYKEYHENLIMIMREGAQNLEEREILNRFYREPKFSEKDYRVSINEFNLEKMIAAFSGILEKIEKKDEIEKTKTITKEKVSISDKVQILIKILKKKTRVRFSSLFDKDTTKEGVINTFLAVLMILKNQYATATQDEKFGDIVIDISDSDNNLKDEEISDAKQFEEFN